MVDNNFNENLENSGEPEDDDLKNEIKRAMSESFDDDEGDDDYEDDDETGLFGDDGGRNGYASALGELILMPKPFGMTWGRDQMENFLRKRGYRIITRYSASRNGNYPYVIRPDEDLIPENDGKSNIVDVFSDEIREIILSWLLKIGKDGSNARGTD